MKSKDQQLLEEAYASITEGKYTDNYGRSKFKPKGNPLSDFDDSAREELRNDERNAGLEDEEPVANTAPSQPSPSSEPQAAAAPEAVDFDLSTLADKEINPVMWDYPDVVMQINGKTVGPMFSKEQGVELAKLLKAGDANNPLVQQFLKGAKNMGDLDKLR
jgi:hypothetical protein